MFKSQIGGLALNRRKWPEMGPEWSPGPENRPPGMPRPFSRLWDRSRGPKPPKYSPNSRSTAPGGRYWDNQHLFGVLESLFLLSFSRYGGPAGRGFCGQNPVDHFPHWPLFSGFLKMIKNGPETIPNISQNDAKYIPNTSQTHPENILKTS